MSHCAGGCDWFALKDTLMVCTKCGARLKFASAKKLKALVGARKDKS